MQQGVTSTPMPESSASPNLRRSSSVTPGRTRSPATLGINASIQQEDLIASREAAKEETKALREEFDMHRR